MPPSSRWKPLRTALAAAPERLLHPLRRWRARSMVADLEGRAPILFVCHGNICRSPYAERSFRRRLLGTGRPTPEIRSAGFIGPGRASPPHALAEAGRRGVDLSDHRSQLLEPGLVRQSGLVVVMDGEQRRALARLHGRGRWKVLILGDLDPQGIGRRGVSDPFDGDEEVFSEVFERIDRCVESLMAVLAPAPGTSSSGSVVPAAGGGVPPRPRARQ